MIYCLIYEMISIKHIIDSEYTAQYIHYEL